MSISDIMDRLLINVVSKGAEGFSMQKLYKELEEAYSEKNLNRITAKLIDLYRNKNYDTINDLAGKICSYTDLSATNTPRRFSLLMQLYHPDRGEFYRECIKKSFEENNHKELKSFSHIFLMKDIENIPAEIPLGLDEDIDYNPEYIWEEEAGNGFHSIYEDQEFEEEPWNQNVNSFFSAVKFRLYGNLRINLNPVILFDMEEVELPESGIDDLEGLQYCEHALYLDLSRNRISDLYEIWELIRLQDLYLADNNISCIDQLSNLVMLRNLDLSNNYIEDITPLINLPRLGYVNLTGNPVPEYQIRLLTANDVLVIS